MRITRATPDDLDTLIAFRDEAAAWLARKGIDQWQEPWPTEDLMVEGMLRNIEAGETFIVWDDDTPAATITINHFAKPELWTPEEAAEPALYAHKVTVDRAHGGHDLGVELLDWAGTKAADEGADWLRVDVWTTNERLRTTTSSRASPTSAPSCCRITPRGRCPAASPARPDAAPARGSEPDRLGCPVPEMSRRRACLHRAGG
jgi:GNAT superfamily N-acetyltransferase